MTTSHFSVTEHILPCQHVREYPNAVRLDDAPLRLAIKEYRPLAGIKITTGAVTIIATHGNGFPKEVYEPLFDDLCENMGGKIRSIWIADCSHQGASGVFNKDIQGDDPSWFDHSRDLLCMINHFRHKMARPIIGLGHSFGAAQLVYLSLFHPRLFHSLALIEPVIQAEEPPGSNISLPSTFRRDIWPSRNVAESSFRAHRAFKDWDPRVLERYLKYGLRETGSTLAKATPTPDSVTLTTTTRQEVWTNLRSNFITVPDDRQAWLVAPDTATQSAARLFYRPEVILTFRNLPSLRPNVMWLFGSTSPFNGSETSRAGKVERTGAGMGGSGGARSGKVENVVVEESGHLLPLQKTRKCALELAPWIERQIQDFITAESFLQNHDSGRSTKDYGKLSKLWLENVRLESHTKRAERSRL